MMKKFLMIAGLVVAAGIAYGLYEFNRKGTDFSSKSPDFTLSVAELASEFESNEASANEKYLGKLIEVKGTVLSQELGDNLILTLKGTDLTTLRAELAENQKPKLVAGNEVRVKGVCTGYLLDVVLTECVIID